MNKEYSTLQDICKKCRSTRAVHRFDKGCVFEKEEIIPRNNLSCYLCGISLENVKKLDKQGSTQYYDRICEKGPVNYEWHCIDVEAANYGKLYTCKRCGSKNTNLRYNGKEQIDCDRCVQFEVITKLAFSTTLCDALGCQKPAEWGRAGNGICIFRCAEHEEQCSDEELKKKIKLSEEWKKCDRPCAPCRDCGAELYEKFVWSKTDKATDRMHGSDDCVKRLRDLLHRDRT